MRAFGSDNYAGVHPEVLTAIVEANSDHARSYGADPWTARAEEKFRELFGAEARTYFVTNGTAANTLALASLGRPYNAVVCAATAHINVDECGAPERFTGMKLLTVDGRDGKLTPEMVEPRLASLGDVHRNQPLVISISQATEYGTVYTPDEIRALADYAHGKGLYLHLDGARIANAAAYLGCSLREMVTETGVDALAFGGTKNGMMYGEAVIFLNPDLGRDFPLLRKQGMQLLSKMRFVSAQFLAMLENDLWLRSAQHANAMAAMLAEKLDAMPGVRVSRPVESNGVFAIMPKEKIKLMQERAYFYMWDEAASEVRIMLSWDTRPDEVDAFAKIVADVAGA